MRRQETPQPTHDAESAASPLETIGFWAARVRQRFCIKLTDRVIAALTCPAGRKDALFFDGEPPGFGLRVTDQGVRMFLFQYRAAGKVRRMRLGQWGHEGKGLTVAQARKLAAVHFGTVKAGGDPVAQEAARAAATAEADAEAKRARRTNAYTLAVLIRDWEHKHLASMRPSYRRDAVGRLRLHLKGMLEDAAGSITRADVVAATDRIAVEAGETTARRTVGYARSAYGWAVRRGTVEINPFLDVPVPGREVRRDRVLTPGEVAEVWAATAGLPAPYGPFVRFLLLTLQRRDEVAGMTWGEVSPDGTLWELPAARAKNGKAHLIHLAPAARAELDAIGRGEPHELVFRGPLPTRGRDGKMGRRGVTAFSYVKRLMDEAMMKARTEAASVAGTRPEPLLPWRLHDFRRTGVTRLAEMGHAPHVADRLLNHVQGTISGVAAVYQRGEFLAERKDALESWGEAATQDPLVMKP